jgi:hypothetical protein
VLVGLSTGQIAIFDLRQPKSTPPKIISVPGPQKTNFPVHSIHVIRREKLDLSEEFIIVAATMEGPFAVKLLTDSNSEDLVTWSSNFGYKNFTCNSLSLDPINGRSFLASYRSVPPREPSRHLIFEFSSKESTKNSVSDSQLKLQLPFSEFKSVTDGPNKIPFRSSLISSSSSSSSKSIECFIPDEINFSCQCYQLNPSNENYTISSQLPPSEILSTNAGTPIIEICVGIVGKGKRKGAKEEENNSFNNENSNETIVIGMLTTKNLYIYTS